MAKKGSKGATNTWIVFVNDYRLKNAAKFKGTKNANIAVMKEAAIIWKAMPKTQQAAFVANPAITKVKEVLKEVKEVLKEVKEGTVSKCSSK